METKTLEFDAVEFKFKNDDWLVSGYASVFDSTDSHGDTVIKGAFMETLQAAMPDMRYEHSRVIRPGRWIEAAEDQKGLRVTGELTPGHTWANDIRASLRHGTLRGLSIGFPPPSPEAFERKAIRGRVLKKLDLVEVSFTGLPSEPQATVDQWKSELGSIENLSDFETFLRESGNGFSKSMATALTGHLKRLIQSESGATHEEVQRETAEEFKALLNRHQLRILQLTQESYQ